MKTIETCPLCTHPMDEHLYKGEDGRTWILYYCPICECDWAAVGYNEFVALDEPFGTRPVDVIITEVDE